MAYQTKSVDDSLRNLRELETLRENWDSHWGQVAEVVWPEANDFNELWSRGEKRNEKLFDSTAALALEKFAAVLESVLTPRAQQWHSLRSTNDGINADPQAQAWFEAATKSLFRIRGASSAAYYTQMHTGYKSQGAFGNDCMFIDGRKDGRGIRYSNCHVGQVYVENDDAGTVDTIYYKFKLSAKAATQRWGDDEMATLPSKVAHYMENNRPYERSEYVHCVTPNLNPDIERKDYKGMAFTSYYICLDTKELVKAGGYEEMPYTYARYTVNPRENYGRSPAMLALPSIRMAQEMQKTRIRAGRKVVDPPLLARHDGVIGHGSQSIRLNSGGITYGGIDASGRQMIQPLQTGARIDLSDSMLEAERRVINDAFLVTLFQILVEDRGTMTATEVLERAQEKGQLLAPTVGRQQSEKLGPQINRELHLAYRMGLLPEMPAILRDAEDDYDVVYESPAVRMARSEELVGIQRTMDMGAPFFEADPSKLELMEFENIMRASQEINGAPVNMLKSPEAYAQVLQQMQEQREQAQQMEQLERSVPAAQGLAEIEKMRSETA